MTMVEIAKQFALDREPIKAEQPEVQELPFL